MKTPNKEKLKQIFPNAKEVKTPWAKKEKKPKRKKAKKNEGN